MTISSLGALVVTRTTKPFDTTVATKACATWLESTSMEPSVGARFSKLLESMERQAMNFSRSRSLAYSAQNLYSAASLFFGGSSTTL